MVICFDLLNYSKSRISDGSIRHSINHLSNVVIVQYIPLGSSCGSVRQRIEPYLHTCQVSNLGSQIKLNDVIKHICSKQAIRCSSPTFVEIMSISLPEMLESNKSSAQNLACAFLLKDL